MDVRRDVIAPDPDHGGQGNQVVGYIRIYIAPMSIVSMIRKRSPVHVRNLEHQSMHTPVEGNKLLLDLWRL